MSAQAGRRIGGQVVQRVPRGLGGMGDQQVEGGRETRGLRLPVAEQRGRDDQQGRRAASSRAVLLLVRSSAASTWIVLPSPMSSARQAPTPSCAQNQSQFSSVELVVAQELRRNPAAAGPPTPRACAVRPAVSAKPVPGLHHRPGRRSSIGCPPVLQIARSAGQQSHPLDERDAVGPDLSRDLSPSERAPRAASRRPPRPTRPAAGQSPSPPASSTSASCGRLLAIPQRQRHVESKQGVLSQGGFLAVQGDAHARAGALAPPVGQLREQPAFS